MNLKQLSILIVLVLIVGGVGRVLYKKNAESWQSSDAAAGKKLLGEFPINDVAEVTIKHQTNVLNLVKKEDRWRVRERYDYPANFGDLREMLNKVWDLKGVQKVAVGASQLPRLELRMPDTSTNSGTLLEFKDKSGKVINSLLLGKKHMRKPPGGSPSPFGGEDPGWPDGRYVMLVGGSGEPNVWVVSDPFSNAEPKPEQWIQKDFVKVEKIKSVSVVSTNETNSWKVYREKEGGELKLADKKEGEELDTSKTWGIGNLMSSASLTDVLPPDAKPEAWGLDKPTVATVDTFDGFTYKIQVGHGTNDDNLPVRVSVTAELPKERVADKDEKPEDKEKLDKEFKEKNEKLAEKLKQEQAFEPWTVLVSKWTIDSLLKGRGELLAAKKEEPKSVNPEEAGHEPVLPAGPGGALAPGLDVDLATPPAPGPAVNNLVPGLATPTNTLPLPVTAVAPLATHAAAAVATNAALAGAIGNAVAAIATNAPAATNTPAETDSTPKP